MAWFKVDDALAMHVKAFAAGNAALGLWVRAGSWSMQQLTDGFIPQGVVAALGGGWDDAAALINAGLWHQADGGYQFHDWAEYQPTREQVLAERAAATERKRRSRERSQSESRRDGGQTVAVSPASPSRPVPTRPQTGTHLSESSHVPERAREIDETAEASRSVLEGLGIDPHKLLDHIGTRTGRAVTLTTAMRIATDILGRGDAVKNPQAYVLGSITKSFAEVQQYIDSEAA